MIKQTITYTDFNGDERVEDFWFHLDKADLLEFEAGREGGMKAYLEDIVKSNKNQEILDTFKIFLQKSIGRRSEDGRRFIRNQDIRDEFMQTNAYSDFLFHLANNAEEGARFIAGILPENLRAEVEDVITPEAITNVELPADTSTNDAEVKERSWYDHTRDELLAMDNVQFDKMFSSLNPKPQLLLSVAMERRTKQ